MRPTRTMRTGAIAIAMVMLPLAISVAANATVSVDKYTADIAPHAVDTSTTVTFTATIVNKALRESLGSCNITAPSGFALQSTNQPVPSGSETLVGNVIQLRNLSTQPSASRSVAFVAQTPAAAGTYTWSVVCREKSNFSTDDDDAEDFVIDGAHSNVATTVTVPVPQADLAAAQTDSPDPVVGSNTVQYVVTVTNNGPATSGNITLNDSLPSGGAITSISGSGWSCSGAGASGSCTSAPLSSGTSAPPVQVLVAAPAADTTITNHAVVSESGAADPNGANNASDESTTVRKDSTCSSGVVSCGSGRITYNLPSQVTTGSTPTATRFLVGTTIFDAVSSATGGQIWSMSAPAVPGNFCPTNLADTAVTQCTWQMNLDPIPTVYPAGHTTFSAICYVTRCPQGLLPGAGTIVVKIDDAGNHTILPACSGSGDTSVCYTQQRISGGHLKITVFNLPPGDPRIGGVCLGGGC